MTDKEKATEFCRKFVSASAKRVANKNFCLGCAYKRRQVITMLEERKKGWEYSLAYGGDFVKGALKAVNELLEELNREDRENPIYYNDRVLLGLKPIKY